MAQVPSNLKYTESHEWLRPEADGTITVGITEHAQAELGDLVYVELVNEQPFEGGWLFRIKPANAADLDSLLSAEDYAEATKD